MPNIAVVPIITTSMSDVICKQLNENSKYVADITKYFCKIESFNTSVVKSIGNIGILVTVDGVDRLWEWNAKYASKFRSNLPEVVPVNFNDHIIHLIGECMKEAKKKNQLKWWDLQSKNDNPLSGTSSYVVEPKLSKSS
mgnify:CR=1 FL=1